MEILDAVYIQDLFLYLQKYHVLILSDVHIGYEESLNRRGMLIPKYSYSDLMLRIEKAIFYIKKSNKIDKIIINGDLIHEFGKVSRNEKDLVQKFIKLLSNYGEVYLVEGNHDAAAKYFLGENIKLVKKFSFGDVLIIHGDKLPLKEDLKGIKTIIIGHEHPAVSISSGPRSEKFKCFLRGKYERRNLIVMPSSNLFLEGTDVLREKLLSSILKKCNLNTFEVYIVEDKIYDFGKLGRLGKL